jgi:glyoxylase-like metal-dependent hydrolase (beta-lactamase superfamily II)
MSPSDANPVKGSSSPPNATYAAVLTWEVFVTPGLPIVTADRPPSVRETYFQAMASTLIYGARDAVLVDAFMTVKQANALADWVASKNKNLTTIYITHGQGDHWFGIGTLLERFPNAKAVASADAVTVMRQNASSEFLRTVWKAAFPSQIPNNLVIAEELKGNVIDLEGQELVAVELGHTDTDHTTCLYVPSIGLVVAGDAVRRLSKRRGGTSAISTGWRKPRKPTRCWSCIRTGLIPRGPSGVPHAQSNQRVRPRGTHNDRDRGGDSLYRTHG